MPLIGRMFPNYVGVVVFLSTSPCAWTSDDAIFNFEGPIEILTNTGDADYVWLESPLWSDSDEYLLFSDVKWAGPTGETTGTVWKYDSRTGGVTSFLREAGIVGPGAPPMDLASYAEAGPNGLHWSWSGDPMLMMCQHGMKRIVQLDVNDVSNGSISSEKVTVVVDMYGNVPLNSPNDLTLVDGKLFFTDPPFGLQFYGDDTLDLAYSRATQNVTGVYALTAGSATTGPQLLLDTHRPNGIAVSSAHKKMFVARTDFDNPGYSVFDFVDDDLTQIDAASERRFNMTHRINETVNPGLPPLTDGMTSHGDVIFAAGPGGVYVLDGASDSEVAFLRIDDLVSNTAIGGGFLWITANQRLLRVKLVPNSQNSVSKAVLYSLALVRWLVVGWLLAGGWLAGLLSY